MKHDINTVLDTGQELFRTRGYFNTGTEEILEKSGYPRSSFYYHFKSKEGFANQVLESYGDASAAYYRDQLFGDADAKPIDRISSFIHKTIDHAVQGEFKSDCLIQKFSIECAGINENLRSATRRQINKMLNVLEECVVEGQHAGEIRQDTGARELAELVQSQLYGSFILGRLASNGEGMKKNMQRVLDYMKCK